MGYHQPPPASIISQQVRIALDEDIGSGDLTAELIALMTTATATIICREAMVVCGIPWVEEVFKKLNDIVTIEWSVQDGEKISANSTLCTLHGNARTILTGERTALNFLQTLSATATLAHSYAVAVAKTNVRILDTRKTLPGLRLAQKYAVRCGGCHNHRLGLFDAILIKENHIQAAGSIAQAIFIANQQFPNVNIEIEVESITELHEALAAGAKHILLDNFDIPALKLAVAETKGLARLEVSGGVNLDNVTAIAETGINDISIGDLTKNIKAIDLSMRIIF